MKPSAPTVIADCERLMFEAELVVADFPVKHRHLIGQDIRRLAYESHALAEDAWRASKNRAQQLALVLQLIAANDHLKRRLRVAKRLQAMSTGRFEAIAGIASGVGKQCGGWLKAIEHPKGQNSNA